MLVATRVAQYPFWSQGKAENDHHQDDADPKIHLARSSVSTVDHDLHEVEDEQDIHHRGRVMMDPAQQPTAVHFVLDVINAFPGRLGTGAVSHPKKKPGDKLHGQAKHQGAAPDITPPRSAWHPFIECRMHELFITRATVQPTEEYLHATGIFLATPAR